jgi:hypothetical protein
MEAIPEATIDVGGGSQSLDIEGLGVKRRKDDLSVATASTSQLAVEDLFGDLLDEVNFSDPSSVDAFREAAAGRINEFDASDFGNILGQASTVASDVATFTSQFQDRPQPQQQFEQVFGPPDTTSSDDAGDIGLDTATSTATSTEVQDISDLTNPGLAAGLFGSAIGSFGRGATLTDFASGLATRGLGELDVVGAFGGFNATQSLANAEITDFASASKGLADALSVGQRAAKVADLVNSNVTVSDLISQATKSVGEYIEGVYTAITNPAQTMEAYGRQMQYGTLTPDLYSFDFPGGPISFAFDKKTGKVATPGLIAAMMPAPMRAFYSVAQFAQNQLGYSDAIADRNVSAIDAYSMPGIDLGPMSVHSSSVDSLTGVDPETGAASVVGAFGALNMSQAGFGTVGFDLGALAEAIGTGTINDLSFADFQGLAVGGGLGQGPGSFDAFDEDAVMAQQIASEFSEAGLNTAADISAAAERASQLTAAFATELEAITDLDLTSLEAVDVAGRAGVLSASDAAAIADVARTDPAGVLGARIAAEVNVLERQYDFGVMSPLDARQAGQEALTEAREEALSSFAEASIEDYNRVGPPSNLTSIDIAERTMSITGRNTVNYARDKAVVDEVTKDITAENRTSGDLDFGYGDVAPSIGPSGISASGYEEQGLQAGRTGQVGVSLDFMEAIAGIEDAPSFDKAPDYDPGVDEPGSPDSDSDSDSKVICTALKDMGLLDKELWQHDGAYGLTLPLETRQGYWAWGVPTAKFIRKNRWAAKAIRPVVTEVAKEMAHRVGYGRGSKLGAALLYVGLPMCRVINRIKNNGNNTRSVYS